jgi:hypothetical protein
MRNLALCSFLCTCGLALFLSSCEPAPTEQQTTTEAKDRTNVRLAKRNANDEFIPGKSFTRAADHIEQILPAIYQNEGPAWENENVGFRMYFDKRNGIDVHGKKVRDLVLDTVGLDRNNYHEMSDWGMDVLKVGNSLGAGAIALMIGDSVYRLGDTGEETVSIVEDTPNRSAFQVEYKDWQVAGRNLNLTWHFAIEAGTHHYTATVTATGLTGGEELLAGIVNLHSDTLYTAERNGRFITYTHGPQAELDNYLGLAISTDAKDHLGHGELAPDAQPVSSTYYVRMPLVNAAPVSYNFTAGWAPGHPEFEQREAFLKVIQ